MCVCVCVCAHVCARVCARVRACVRACVRARVCVYVACLKTSGIMPFICFEMVNRLSDKIVPFLVHLFKKVFTSGEYPEAWTEAVIYPLHKKGSIHEPDNYRGISLLNFIVTLLTNDYQYGLKTMTMERSKQVFARTTLPLIISLHYFLCYRDIY